MNKFQNKKDLKKIDLKLKLKLDSSDEDSQSEEKSESLKKGSQCSVRDPSKINASQHVIILNQSNNE